MNKLIHDTSTSLTLLVQTLSKELKETIRPQLNQLSTSVTSITTEVQVKVHPEVSRLKSSIASVSTDITDNVKPSIKALQLEMQNKENGVKPRLERLEAAFSESQLPSPNLDPDQTAVLKKATGPLDSGLAAKLTSIQTNIDKLSKHVDEHAVTLGIISQWSDIMYKDTHSLQEHIHHNTAKHCFNEVVIGGIKQTKKENCKKAVVDFLQQKMTVQTMAGEIWHAYRKGSSTTKMINGQRIQCPPQMIARVPHHLRAEIMKNVGKLKGKMDPDAGFKYYVIPHTPEAFRAARAKHQQRIDDIKKDNELLSERNKRHTRLTGTQFFVNNVIQLGLLQPPHPLKSSIACSFMEKKLLKYLYYIQRWNSEWAANFMFML